ncbi:MAG: hypothetical protein AMJ79_14635 [Phycisphaerae bacterium SM23_30]|nr:MAG: hypothetical protein AMJ79_14635 [Phycisphaerae bacterium SM23_30]
MAPIEPFENDDLLEQATRDLRRTPIPEEIPADAIKAVLTAAPENFKIRSRSAFAERIKILKNLTKIAAALIIVTGTIGLFLLFYSHGPVRSPFTRIVEPLLAARTATFKVTFDIEGSPLQTHDVMFMDPALLRQTWTDFIQIMDFTQGETLTLTPEQRFAVLAKMENPPSNQFNFPKIKELLRQAQQNERAMVESLGQKQIAGQTAVGYRINHPPMEMTVWADADNQRPIRMESSIVTEGKKRSAAIHDFVFDIDLDKRLFSLKPPENYFVIHHPNPLSPPFWKELVDPFRGSLKAQRDVQQLPPVMALMMVRRIIIL